jgi:hypothetical protein
MNYEEKFIAFIDILGFKNMVEKSESGTGMQLSELMSILSSLSNERTVDQIKRSGACICPTSQHIDKDLNFKVTQISDCAIISSEVSPAGIINLVYHCWGAAMNLMMQGIMCRGYITRGMIYHKNNQVIGSGYQKAYKNESTVGAFSRHADDLGTPFIEIDPIVCSFVRNETDPCVIELFDRFTKTQDSTTAIFPFQVLSHQFMISKNLDIEKELTSNNNIRNSLLSTKEKLCFHVDEQNSKAMLKLEHYLIAIDEQIKICNKTDQFIKNINKPLRFHQ